MTTEPQVLQAGDWDAWYETLVSAFGGVESPEERRLSRELAEPGRALAVWDGDEVVGTAAAHSFRMTVPGGAVVPTAGVTMVQVSAAHRRRGILRSLMRRQLDDIREAGREPLAALTASEPGIYGRFGYGLATRQMNADIDVSRTGFPAPTVDNGVRLRIVDEPSAVRELCERIYAREVARRPGMLERRPGWEQVPLLDPKQDREGASPLRCVLAERNGAVGGYARYAVKADWDEQEAAQGAVLLRDLAALDPVAYASLWRFLSRIDLTTVLRVRNRPVDDPWLHSVTDVRRCGLRWRDGLFVRLVDVGGALTARAYQAPLDVVLEVQDEFCPWNAGRWRLSGDPKGAVCERTADAAELTLSAAELGAAYLGGESLTSLGWAGRVQEERQGALRAASVAFGSDLAPWLPHTF